MKGTKITEEERKTIQNMLREDKNAREIAKQIGISVRTVHRIRQQMIEKAQIPKPEKKVQKEDVQAKPRGMFRTPYSSRDHYYVSRY